MRAEIFLQMLPMFIVPTRRMFYRGFQWSTVKRLNIQQSDPVIDQIIASGTSFKPGELGLGVVTVFSDDELRCMDRPTLLLVGDHEKIFDPKRMLERARRLMPRLEAEMIPDAAHLLPIDQPETVNQRILAFLG